MLPIQQTTAPQSSFGAEPQPMTHTIIVDMLLIDGTSKRMEIGFCKTDKWSNTMFQDAANISELIVATLWPMFAGDQFTVGFQYDVLNRITGNKFSDSMYIHPVILRPDLFRNGHTPAA